MTATACVPTQTKLDILAGGVHNIATDTFNVALFTDATTIGPLTPSYNTSLGGECPQIGGYQTGGKLLGTPTVTSSGNIAYMDFPDVTWTNVTFSGETAVSAAAVYNISPGKNNKILCICTFAATTVIGGSFILQWPVDASSTAILRLV